MADKPSSTPVEFDQLPAARCAFWHQLKRCQDWCFGGILLTVSNEKMVLRGICPSRGGNLCPLWRQAPLLVEFHV